MSATASELAAKRRGTKAFIDRDPNKYAIVLSREDLEWSGGSFNRTNLRSLKQQPMVLVATNQQLPERRTLEGQSLTPEFVLIGEYGTDIRNGDWFYLDGVKYEVVFVREDRSYEVVAEVVYRG